MSDYLGDESPWAQPILDNGVDSAFDAHEDDISSPWGGNTSGGEHGDFDKTDASEDYNPYGDSNDPLVANESEAPASASNGSEQDPERPHSTETVPAESVPVLKQPKSKTNKKKRAGTVKVESGGADPLAASAVQLDSVALTAQSVDGLSLETESVTDDPLRSAMDSEANNAPDEPGAAKPFAYSASPAPVQRSPHVFEINVSDPAMVGDLTSAHTEYTVQMTTTHPRYEAKEAAVQRRYRDFRLLYRTLEHNHPGIIVPPPPGKQALGRFNDDFVQQRRAALEQMLRKITVHVALSDDADLEAFLTAADFGEHLKSRNMTDEQLDNDSRPISTQADSVPSSNGGSGFIGSLSGALSLSRGTEVDPWTVEKRAHLDKVETQLREVSRELVTISLHRQQLSDSLRDFANVVRVLSDIEATRRLSTVLSSFAKVHERLAQVYERQRQQNLLTLEATLDEYLRTVGSVRDAIAARQRIFTAAEQAGSELEKRQAALDKLVRQNRTQEDRHKALEEEIEQLSRSASSLHRQAGNVAHLVDSEISRVNEEHIEELRNSVEIYLENTVEAQKESIEVWETFYTRNFAS